MQGLAQKKYTKNKKQETTARVWTIAAARLDTATALAGDEAGWNPWFPTGQQACDVLACALAVCRFVFTQSSNSVRKTFYARQVMLGFFCVCDQ